MSRQAALLLIAVGLGIGTYAYESGMAFGIVQRGLAVSGLDGNPSDLYPRWIGTYALLWQGRDPYSAVVTRDIQIGYYGRALLSTDPVHDEQGFAYPLHVIFVVAPLTLLPWPVVYSVVAPALEVLLIGGSSLVWASLLWGPLTRGQAWLIGILTLSWWPVQQAVSIRQLAVVVLGAFVGAVWCLNQGARQSEKGRATRWYIGAGVLLALTTIKPQLAALPTAGLLVWAAMHWRTRRGLIEGFALALAVLLSGAFALLPGWPGAWAAALASYNTYTAAYQLLIQALSPVGWVLLAGLLGGVALALWSRSHAATFAGAGPRWALAVSLAVGAFLVPSWAPYNQILMIPGALLLLAEYTSHPQRRGGASVLYALAAGIVLVHWLLTAGAGWLWLAGLVNPGNETTIWLIPRVVSLAVPVVLLAALIPAGWGATAQHDREFV